MNLTRSIFRISQISPFSSITTSPIIHPIRRYNSSSSKNNAMSCSLRSSSAREPVFSSNYSPEQGLQDLKTLLKSEGQGGRWQLIESGKGIERGFKFKGFKKTWEFMNLIAPECITQKHHPEWSNVYNTTFIRWTTHSPSGLSAKDVTMAKFCDLKAVECGEVVPTAEEEAAAAEEKERKRREEAGESEGGGDVGKGLVDRVAVEGGDCCVPKKKI